MCTTTTTTGTPTSPAIATTNSTNARSTTSTTLRESIATSTAVPTTSTSGVNLPAAAIAVAAAAAAAAENTKKATVEQNIILGGTAAGIVLLFAAILIVRRRRRRQGGQFDLLQHDDADAASRVKHPITNFYTADESETDEFRALEQVSAELAQPDAAATMASSLANASYTHPHGKEGSVLQTKASNGFEADTSQLKRKHADAAASPPSAVVYNPANSAENMNNYAGQLKMLSLNQANRGFEAAVGTLKTHSGNQANDEFGGDAAANDGFADAIGTLKTHSSSQASAGFDDVADDSNVCTRANDGFTDVVDTLKAHSGNQANDEFDEVADKLKNAAFKAEHQPNSRIKSGAIPNSPRLGQKGIPNMWEERAVQEPDHTDASLSALTSPLKAKMKSRRAQDGMADEDALPPTRLKQELAVRSGRTPTPLRKVLQASGPIEIVSPALLVPVVPSPAPVSSKQVRQDVAERLKRLSASTVAASGSPLQKGGRDSAAETFFDNDVTLDVDDLVSGRGAGRSGDLDVGNPDGTDDSDEFEC